MIQTQLLKADQPYQIISAGGQVGVQVATLIVTEDKMTEEGYRIDTHSHPVVNYAVKDNLTEELKYWNGDPSEEWKYTQRLQPEGAVWNKVEVRDVRVLGLVGANNPWVDLEKFVSLVPSIPNPIFGSSVTHIWGVRSASSIRNLRWALERVGIKCETSTLHISTIYENQDFSKPLYTPIYLSVEDFDEIDCLVKVQIRKPDEYNIAYGEIAFYCCMKGDSTDFVKTIVRCMKELDQQFIKEGNNIRFLYRQIFETKNEWDKLLELTTESINEAWKNK